jgi:hypothetical protein
MLLVIHYAFTFPGVRKGFVRAVFKKLKADAKDSLPEDATKDAATEATRLEVAFVNALGRKDREEVAQVDMEQELKDLKLYDFFPYAQWPPNAPVCPPTPFFLCALYLNAALFVRMCQVRELKTKVEKFRKRGEPVPFFNVDLKKYAFMCCAQSTSFDCPAWCCVGGTCRPLVLSTWLYPLTRRARPFMSGLRRVLLRVCVLLFGLRVRAPFGSGHETFPRLCQLAAGLG